MNTMPCNSNTIDSRDYHVSLSLVVDCNIGHVYDSNNLESSNSSCDDSGHVMNKSNFLCFISSPNSKDSSNMLPWSSFHKYAS